MWKSHLFEDSCFSVDLFSVLFKSIWVAVANVKNRRLCSNRQLLQSSYFFCSFWDKWRGSNTKRLCLGLSVQEDRHSTFGMSPCQESLKRCNRGLGLHPQASGVVHLFHILFNTSRKMQKKSAVVFLFYKWYQLIKG